MARRTSQRAVKNKKLPAARRPATFTAVIEHDRETGLYVGIVPGIPGAHSQGATLDELRRNLAEVLELVLEENEELRRRPPRYIGVEKIGVA